jgi:hypothetical protein
LTARFGPDDEFDAVRVIQPQDQDMPVLRVLKNVVPATSLLNQVVNDFFPGEPRPRKGWKIVLIRHFYLTPNDLNQRGVLRIRWIELLEIIFIF